MENRPLTESKNQNKGRAKRVVSNSLALFVRVFFITIINLFAVRYVLSGLGSIDYGIYNAIAGVVMTSACILSVLSTSIQRFYSFAMGSHVESGLSNIFAASINIITVLIIVLFITFETAGYWFVSTYMDLPIERMHSALVIFQCVLVSFAFMLMQVPYSAAIFAHEQMGTYAFLSVTDATLRFLFAFLIVYAPIDRLEFYGYGMMLSSAAITLLYVLICRYRYAECHYTKVTDNTIYRSLLSFSGSTLYGAVASMGMLQGSTILLNIFFGPLVNAAFGIANNLYNALGSLANSIVLPFRPTIIKSYAQNDRESMMRLFDMNNKVLIYLLLATSIPLCFCMHTILDLWLVNITGQMVLFAQLFVVYTCCISLHHPITTMMQATGHVHKYFFATESFTIMNIPLAWILFKLGYPAHAIFGSMITLCLLAHIVRMGFLQYHFPELTIVRYLVKFMVPASIVGFITVLADWQLCALIEHSWIQLISISVFSPIIVLILAFCFNTSKEERQQVKAMVLKRIHLN